MAGLERILQAMPETVGAVLKKRGLTAAYETRPACQRNDYLGWIAQAACCRSAWAAGGPMPGSRPDREVF